jgi:hypothetical protein
MHPPHLRRAALNEHLLIVDAARRGCNAPAPCYSALTAPGWALVCAIVRAD